MAPPEVVPSEVSFKTKAPGHSRAKHMRFSEKLQPSAQVFCYALCFPKPLQQELERELLLALPRGAIVYVTPIHAFGTAVVDGRRFAIAPGGPFMEVEEEEEL